MTADSLDLARLRERFRRRELTASALVADLLSRLAAAGDDKVWITRCADEALRQRAATLDRLDADGARKLPLFGIPFAVKDNIDVAGMPTTAACPDYAYVAAESAPAVQRLLDAGAILVGKTNLDQFATGLVGVRSPYCVPRNPFDDRYIPGGSSSGSAVAVAAGLVSFALGTDTAGSGRVPAGFNNIVGLKPTRGLISARGVVPACRTLDCVSVLALTTEDAAEILALLAGPDAHDGFSRTTPPVLPAIPRPFRFAVPPPADLYFAGDTEAAELFGKACAVLAAMGGTRVEIDFAPFRDAAALLYSGPWVAERLAAIEPLFRRAPEALLPVTRAIIGGGAQYGAVDTFKAMYRLAELRAAAGAVWRSADMLVVPTAPTIYRVDEVEADPVRLNSVLGTYTNFVNLFDLAALALPAGFRSDGLPVGVTVIAPAFADNALAALGADFQRRLDLPLGATGHRLPARAETPAPRPAGAIEIAVVGAHLSGMALNHQLVDRGATLVEASETAPEYRLHLLAGEPARPGLVRCAQGGVAVALEIWAMSPAAFGSFVAAVPPPLAIGTLRLKDGRLVKGFLCESVATAGARDISAFGGWRKFTASISSPS
ncbi:MAG TPA: allophanate hydrolase [Stellaceae bacterium]|nr:allophanate hydrolase [Stellaceae bacterium]